MFEEKVTRTISNRVQVQSTPSGLSTFQYKLQFRVPTWKSKGEQELKLIGDDLQISFKSTPLIEMNDLALFYLPIRICVLTSVNYTFPQDLLKEFFSC